MKRVCSQIVEIKQYRSFPVLLLLFQKQQNDNAGTVVIPPLIYID